MLYLIKLIDFISIVKRVKKVVDNYFVGTIRTSSVSEDKLEVLILKIVQSSNKSSNTFQKLEFL